MNALSSDTEKKMYSVAPQDRPCQWALSYHAVWADQKSNVNTKYNLTRVSQLSCLFSQLRIQLATWLIKQCYFCRFYFAATYLSFVYLLSWFHLLNLYFMGTIFTSRWLQMASESERVTTPTARSAQMSKMLRSIAPPVLLQFSDCSLVDAKKRWINTF